MSTNLFATALLSLGLMFGGATQTVKQAAAADCCASRLACCSKDKGCCVAPSKLGCCDKGLACCAQDKACCGGPQACCKAGAACCAEARACCGQPVKQQSRHGWAVDRCCCAE